MKPEFLSAIPLFLILIGALVGIAIIIAVCYFFMTCLQRIPAEHRKMEPGMVWLLAIPCFGLVWAFFVGLRIPESFKSYFDSQNRTDVGDCGRQIGLIWAICGACSILPIISILAGPASLVLLIVFMVKMNDLKGKIAA